jgi:lipopolysaccharide/colanic/teichoic acid biosynthesis glycosyltransferase
MDVVFALLGMIPFAVLFLMYVPVLMLVDPGKPLVTNIRIGRDRRPFQFIQFRTVRIGTVDTDACKVSYWMRRAGLDEVPQIFNILRGDMSVVGPRPFTIEYEATLRARIPGWDARYAATPGLTSWAEVEFPARDFGNKSDNYRAGALPYDLHYIANRTLKFYLVVVFRSLENLWKGHDHNPFKRYSHASR